MKRVVPLETEVGSENKVVTAVFVELRSTTNELTEVVPFVIVGDSISSNVISDEAVVA